MTLTTARAAPGTASTVRSTIQRTARDLPVPQHPPVADDATRSPSPSPVPVPVPRPRPSDPDQALLDRLRDGDEHAYAELVDSYSRPMLRVALRYARSRAVAEEAVQETWIAVLQGLDRFEGRASFKTWIFRILAHQAQAQAAREVRVLPMTDTLAHRDGSQAEEDLLSSSRDRWPGHWTVPQAGWAARPDDAALAAELLGRLHAAIARLPDRQREVLTLRDVDGHTAAEVCRRLGLQPTNQRVLLHRARAAVRAGVVSYLAPHG